MIGIDEYAHAGSLDYAKSDATAIAETLRSQFAFSSANVTLLLDGEASRQKIIESFLGFRTRAGRDDRIVVFFAGHGCTDRGSRGEVGFLVPADGAQDNLATLIRWDEFTRNAELIPAKHMLFLMDACYGGLMLTRALPSGSARFLRDTLQRHSRQVLTAGKADEVVADSGGPRPDHSIFTGHLLDALEGGAPARDGILTGNSVMAYVFEKVSRDVHSRQTPHYGFFDGDGEFIFRAPGLDVLPPEDEGAVDPLIEVPPLNMGGAAPSEEQSLAQDIKQRLSEPRSAVRLDDAVTAELRVAGAGLQQAMTDLATEPDKQRFVERLQVYEQLVERLVTTTILLGRWADADQQAVLARVPARVGDQISAAAGLELWLNLRWYPLYRLLYAGGMAAVSAGNYKSLSTLLLQEVGDRRMSPEAGPAILVATYAVTDLHDWFKTVPGHEKQVVPISEYLFKSLQPQVDDALFLGGSYEQTFDKFEVLRSLIVADVNERNAQNSWGPSGRFSWKQKRAIGPTPFDLLVAEAKREADGWGPLGAGLFDGSAARFKEVADRYRREILTRGVS